MGCGASAQAPSPESIKQQQVRGGGNGGGTKGQPTDMGIQDDAYEMDDEVAQQTALLSDSLGGNAKTLMFVNASPADYNTAETNNALKFATRVKKVINQSTKTVETKQIKLLKEQLRQAKEALARKK